MRCGCARKLYELCVICSRLCQSGTSASALSCQSVQPTSLKGFTQWPQAAPQKATTIALSQPCLLYRPKNAVRKQEPRRRQRHQRHSGQPTEERDAELGAVDAWLGRPFSEGGRAIVVRTAAVAAGEALPRAVPRCCSRASYKCLSTCFASLSSVFFPTSKVAQSCLVLCKH